MEREDDWDWEALRLRCLREARRVGLSAHDAEDAAQESLLRAWRMRGRCLDPSAAEAWAGTIGRREALRLGAPRRETAAAFDVAADHAATDDPEARAVGREAATMALRSLGPADQTALMLRYGLDLPHREIARLLGQRESSTAVRLHRARSRLRRALDWPDAKDEETIPELG